MGEDTRALLAIMSAHQEILYGLLSDEELRIWQGIELHWADKPGPVTTAETAKKYGLEAITRLRDRH